MDKWVICKRCGHEYSSRLSRCPNCNSVTFNFKLIFSIIVCFIVLGVTVMGFAMGFGDKSKESGIDISSQNVNTSYFSSSSAQEQSNANYKPSVNAVSSKNMETNSDDSVWSKVVADESSTPVTSTPKVIANPKVGTEFLGDFYYITCPEYYLRYVYDLFGMADTGVSFEKFAYELSEEDKKSGFIGIQQNADGSVTRYIGQNNYNKYLSDFVAGLLITKIEMQRLDYIESIKSSDNYESIDIKLKKEELSITEKTQIIIFGCTAAEKQLSTVNSKNNCTITLTFSNGKTEKIIFPDCLKN